MPSFPPVTNRALAIVLAGAHRSGTELAALAGLRPGTVSAYISGRKTLSMENLFRFASLLGVESPGALDAVLLASRLGPGAAPGRPALVAKLGRLTEELVEARLPELLEASAAHEERRRARELWSALSDRPAKDWQSVLTELPRLAYRSCGAGSPGPPSRTHPHQRCLCSGAAGRLRRGGGGATTRRPPDPRD